MTGYDHLLALILSILFLQSLTVVTAILIGVNSNPVFDEEKEIIFSYPKKIFLLFTYFSYIRRVKIDKKLKLLKISKRIFWVFNSVRHIHFNDIDSIGYKYFPFGGVVPFREDCEEFYITINLKNKNEIKLFSFFGLDATGTQGYCSRTFVEKLSKLMGKNLA